MISQLSSKPPEKLKDTCVSASIESRTSRRIHIETQMHLVNWFLIDLIDRKQDTENPDLTVQLDVFDQWKTNDDEQLTGPDGVDLNDHLNVFHAVFKQVWMIYYIKWLIKRILFKRFTILNIK